MNKVIMYILPIIFLILTFLVIFYISKRMSWAFSLSMKITTISFVAIIALFMTSMMVIMRTNAISTTAHILNNISTIGLGIFLMLLISTVAVDLVQIFVKMQPRLFGIIVASLTIALSGYSLWNAQHIRVYQQDVVMPNLNEPMRIAQLSDIHIGHFWGKDTVEELVDIVKNEDVDAVLITGDMFDGRVRLNQEVIRPFNQLNVPVFFIEGNHDGYSGSGDIKRMLKQNGIQVLSNEMIDLNGVQLIGLDYLLADQQTANTFHAPTSELTIKDILPTMGIDRSRPSILLHHNPVGLAYAAESGVNLYLAGHTHAGQLFPATLIARLMFPYNKGLYRYNDDTQIYVSQGSGTFGPPMRLGTHSEVTIFNLK